MRPHSTPQPLGARPPWPLPNILSRPKSAAASSHCVPARELAFIWRKLHSLLGVIPIGAFLLEHLLSNFEALEGPAGLRRAGQVPQRPAAGARSGVGLHLPAHPLSRRLRRLHLAARQVQHRYYPCAGNWLYTAQRYTGLIAFAYIAQHVYRQRFTGIDLPDNPYAAFTRCRWSWPIRGCSPSTSWP